LYDVRRVRVVERASRLLADPQGLDQTPAIDVRRDVRGGRALGEGSRRSGEGDGKSSEEDETRQQAARRDCMLDSGHDPKSPVRDLSTESCDIAPRPKRFG